MWFWKHGFSRLLWPLHNWLIGWARPILIAQRAYSCFARLWHSNEKHLFIKCYQTNYLNREEKSSRHVAIVAKFLDDNKPKTSLKKWIRTVSNFIDLVQFLFYLSNKVGEILWGGGGLNLKGPYLSLKKKKNLCVVFTYSLKQAREISNFHVEVVQRRQRNVEKSKMHVLFSLLTTHFSSLLNKPLM